MQVKQRLDPLTALRFVAAALIVLGHAEELFALTGITSYAPFNQGVSFFFVLSGFILTWNYPTLTNWAERRHFGLARFARVWPVHFVTCILWIALVFEFDRDVHFEGTEGLLKLVTNLLLVQAWIPSHLWQLSFNGVSWSISVELFFYLMFPLLIGLWREQWQRIFLLQAAAIAFFVILAANSKIGLPQLVYFNPVARLLEFSIGIGLAFCVMHISKENIFLKSSQWFTLELVVIWLAVVSMLVTSNPAGLNNSLGAAAAYQFQAAGLWPVWALVIGLFALSHGPIARALSSRIAVFLGEISFSLYLCHALVIHYLLPQQDLVRSTGWFGYLLYWMFCLFFSAFLHLGIETPARKMILSRSIGVWQAARAAWQAKEAFCLVALLSVGATMYFVKPSTNKVVATPALELMTPPAISAFLKDTSNNVDLKAPIIFDERYDMLALRVQSLDADKFEVQVLLRTRIPLRAVDTFAFHLIGADGTMIANFDRVLDLSRQTLPEGSHWLHKYTIPKEQLQMSSQLGFAMYTDSALLFTVRGGNSDWGGKRLIVPFKIDTN